MNGRGNETNDKRHVSREVMITGLAKLDCASDGGFTIVTDGVFRHKNEPTRGIEYQSHIDSGK